MTRDEVLGKTKALIEESCRHNSARLVINMALRGVPPQDILTAYEAAIQWNEETVIDSLRQVERILDEMLEGTVSGA